MPTDSTFAAAGRRIASQCGTSQAFRTTFGTSRRHVRRGLPCMASNFLAARALLQDYRPHGRASSARYRRRYAFPRHIYFEIQVVECINCRLTPRKRSPPALKLSAVLGHGPGERDRTSCPTVRSPPPGPWPSFLIFIDFPKPRRAVTDRRAKFKLNFHDFSDSNAVPYRHDISVQDNFRDIFRPKLVTFRLKVPSQPAAQLLRTSLSPDGARFRDPGSGNSRKIRHNIME